MRLAVFVVCGVGASASKRAVSERTSKPGGKALRLRLGACCSVALPPLRPEGETLGGEGRERQPKLQRTDFVDRHCSGLFVVVCRQLSGDGSKKGVDEGFGARWKVMVKAR